MLDPEINSPGHRGRVDPEPSARRSGWARSIAFALGAWFLSRAVLGLIGAYGFILEGEPVPWVKMWVQWDANYYLSIIEHGYFPSPIVTGLETGQSNLNFFPLLPLGALLFVPFVGSSVHAGLIFSNLCLIAAAIAHHRLSNHKDHADAADWTVLSLMFLPGSFSLSGVMTEAPFLALSSMAAYLSTVGRPATAAGVGALLTITRLTGVAQALGFALDWAIARLRGRPATYYGLLLIVLMPLPLFFLLAYMFHLTGDALVSVHSNFSFWQHEIGFPFQNFFMVLWTEQPRLQVQWFIGSLLLGTLLSQVRHFTAGEWLFVAISVFSFSSSESASPSLLRYMIGLYPLHLAMGRSCSRHAIVRILFLALAMVNGVLMLYWAHGRDFYI